MDRDRETERLLQAIAWALEQPGLIDLMDVVELAAVTGDEESAYRLLLATVCGYDPEKPEDQEIIWRLFPRMVRREEPARYAADAYTAVLRESTGEAGGFRIGWGEFRPCELFVRDDLFAWDGYVLPRLGWFREAYDYPGLWEDGRIWMSITPNEVNTIRPLAAEARGRVLCNGLGLGYYAFHALRNPAVRHVTVVEREESLIRLFSDRVLPRFPNREALTLVHADAFEYVASCSRDWDTVFTDLWHDVGDGLPLYRRMKQMEFPGAVWQYWIEPSLKLYEDP